MSEPERYLTIPWFLHQEAIPFTDSLSSTLVADWLANAPRPLPAICNSQIFAKSPLFISVKPAGKCLHDVLLLMKARLLEILIAIMYQKSADLVPLDGLREVHIALNTELLRYSTVTKEEIRQRLISYTQEKCSNGFK